MTPSQTQICLRKITALLKHNYKNIDHLMAFQLANIVDGMNMDARDPKDFRDGFNQLHFWLKEGERYGAVPEVLCKHLLRHVDAAIRENAS